MEKNLPTFFLSSVNKHKTFFLSVVSSDIGLQLWTNVWLSITRFVYQCAVILRANTLCFAIPRKWRSNERNSKTPSRFYTRINRVSSIHSSQDWMHFCAMPWEFGLTFPQFIGCTYQEGKKAEGQKVPFFFIALSVFPLLESFAIWGHVLSSWLPNASRCRLENQEDFLDEPAGCITYSILPNHYPARTNDL